MQGHTTYDTKGRIEKLDAITEKCLNGGSATREEAEWLITEAPKEALYEAAHRITLKRTKMTFDTCSIINARSGRCSEDCKWCAQSAHYKTEASIYPLVSSEECLELAKKNESLGINRYAIVTSGRGQRDEDVDKLCEMIRDLKKNSKIHICGSLGLVNKEQLKRLKDAGLERVHCNIETAPSLFPKYCTTHTTEMKLKTIQAAKELGLEVCSGGIFGMGETPKERVEFAFAQKDTGALSFPFNVLNPIPGTPLENTAPMSDDELLSTVAMIRFVNPEVYIRFAGGRSKRSAEVVRKSFYVGINSAIMGDMLTTPGTSIQDEFKFIEEEGYELER